MMNKNFMFTKVKEVKTPNRAHPTDAGIDFYYPSNEPDCIIQPNGGNVLIPSGIKVIIPHGYALLGVNKSGIASKKGLVLGAKLIDESYRGEIIINLINTSNKPQTIKPGDKIAQFILIEVDHTVPEEISIESYDMLSHHEDERGEGGFGSTGDR